MNCIYLNNGYCELAKKITGVPLQLGYNSNTTCTQCLSEQIQPIDENHLTPTLSGIIETVNKHKSQFMMPSIVRKAMNYGASLLKYKLAGSPTTPTEIQNERLTICESCDRLEPISRSCYECGCPVDEKVKWGTERCPLGKWEAVVDSKIQPTEPHDSSSAGCGCGS
jgi:hypothetical protein